MRIKLKNVLLCTFYIKFLHSAKFLFLRYFVIFRVIVFRRQYSINLFKCKKRIRNKHCHWKISWPFCYNVGIYIYLLSDCRDITQQIFFYYFVCLSLVRACIWIRIQILGKIQIRKKWMRICYTGYRESELLSTWGMPVYKYLFNSPKADLYKP